MPQVRHLLAKVEAFPAEGSDRKGTSLAVSGEHLVRRRTPRPRPGVPLRPLYELELTESVGTVDFSPDGTAMALSTLGGPVVVLETHSGRPIGQLSGHGEGSLSVAFSPSRLLLATGGQDGKVRVYSWPSLRQVAVWEAGGAWVEQLAWSPTGRYLASGAGRVVRIWTASGAHRGGFENHRGTVTTLNWNPNELTVTSSSYGGLCQLQVGRQKPIHQLEYDGPILNVAFSPDRRFIAATTQDTAVRIWEIKAKKARAYDIPGYKSKVRALAWSADSRWLSTADYKEIALWDFGPKMKESDRALALNAHENYVTGLKFLTGAKGPQRLFSAGSDGQVIAWQPLKSSKPLWKWVTGVALEQLLTSPDGSVLVAVGSKGYVQAWSLRSN
jgi:WD40 repeat protein